MNDVTAEQREETLLHVFGTVREREEILKQLVELVNAVRDYNPRCYAMSCMLTHVAEMCAAKGVTDVQRQLLADEMRRSAFRLEQTARAGEPLEFSVA